MNKVFSAWGRFAKAADGQSIVELALCLPLLVFGVVGGADLARAYALQIAVENGSRAGAEAYAITSSSVRTIGEAQNATIQEINRTPTAAADVNMVQVTLQQLGVTVTSCSPTVAAPCYVIVRVQYGWHTLVAWPLIPTSGTFDRTTSMRTY
ncbi:MAG TPA: TadE family protein [Candidatus Limnocylindria bacterium]|jgi:Flp pilus assembly protein TadG